MKNKKLVSTVVASALVATTMAVPVMAADGGQVDVDIDTKTAVIRVQVPTSLSVAVNQFEKEDTGSQIYSEPFPITNMSEIPVELTVDSELAMDAAVKLLPTKAGAEESTAATGEAWLGVAAKIGANSYVDGDTTSKVDGLTEANKNVTTFVQDETTKTKATAQQVFYLDKAADVSTLTYTSFVPEADGKADISYAQFYKLTPVTISDSTDADASQDELDAAIAAGDVYEIVTATDTATPSGQALKLIAKGTSATFADTNSYFSVATDVTAEADLKTSEKYVYTATAAGGNAAFRYIGKLSEGKATWTDADFKDIHIKYDIVGTTTTKYDDVKNLCTYGLYTPVTGPQVSVSTDGVVSIANLDGSLYASMSVNDGTGDYPISNNDSEGTWDWDDDDASTLKTFTFNSSWSGSTVIVTITLTDGTKLTSESVTLS